ncbi:Hypothetical protein CAP_4183 [Chondromyces apiculatus DSM 436]|uniref:Peptidase C39-like domain-containing protein n=2 Tax=Chondromyces apiculatus TaxID=51 RepID=A0A017T621_9BACT|nr:Hypothetical protein CAP_4183 [Chondromyces apiculatus DSM 436]
MIYARTNTRGFAGVSGLYQYTNGDGTNQDTVCGPAACATLLTYCGLARPDIATLRSIERSHPPDLLFGRAGSSPQRVVETLSAYRARRLGTANNIETLRRCVRASCPVICVIQNTGGLFGLGDGAHWFVVYAYNDAGVFVTNYGSSPHLSWDDFRSKWGGIVSNVARFAVGLGGLFKGITNVGRVLSESASMG